VTHKDAGKYSAKHPAGTRPDPVLAAAVEEVVEDGRIVCAVAHDLAEDLGIAPAEIGKTIDLLEYRISKCQLGLFGYQPDTKIVKPAETVSEELRQRLQNSAAGEQIPCTACWEIAKALGMQKIAVAAACQTLGLKVKPCQLGAF
jgi:hypothetical protein